MIQTEKLHESETNDHEGAVYTLKNERRVQQFITLFVISYLCHYLTTDFEYGNPETKADDANETLAYVNGFHVSDLIHDRLFRFRIGVALFVLLSLTSISEERKPNKDTYLDEKNDQIEEPR